MRSQPLPLIKRPELVFGGDDRRRRAYQGDDSYWR